MKSEDVFAIFSPLRTQLESVFTPAFNSLSQYVQSPNSGHKYWLRLRLSVSVRTATPVLKLASTITG